MQYSVEIILVLGVWLFIVTNLDTLLVISAFCADNEYRIWEVFVGHYIGFSIGLIGAVGGAIIAGELFQEWSFLLGVVPLSIGLWGLFRRPPEVSIEKIPTVPNSAGRIGVVAVAGIGLSGENIAVFIPFFTDLAPNELALIIGVYVISAGIVFLTALIIVYRVAVDGISTRLDRWLVPSVLVIVGGYVVGTGIVAT